MNVEVEIKALLHDSEAIQKILRERGGQSLSLQRVIDTYYNKLSKTT